MIRYRLIFLFALTVLAFLPNVHAAPANLTITPSSQAVPQGTSAGYTINLAMAAANASYVLSVSGLSSGKYQFSPNPIVIPNVLGGSGSSSLTISTSNAPGLYCPGTYPFTVTATSSSPADSGSASGTLTVVQVGPPLSVTVSTDKSAYRIGDKITISIAVNRPAEGLLTISPPSGAPATFQSYFTAPTYSIAQTLTAAQPTGRWTISFQADDYCSGFSSAVAYFDVAPDTYDVSLSLAGMPPEVSVGIQVDGQSQGTIAGSEIKRLSFKVDTTHTIMVDQNVPGASGVRYFCSQTSWTVSSSGSHTFTYQPQYLLTVGTNPDGITQVTGGGWYAAGTSIQTNQAAQTIAGGPGTQYLFKGWEVDGVLQSGNPLTITLDKPHKAIARYSTQYQLVVDSPYGSPKGSGFYDAGSTAQFSVTSPAGFLIQQVFVKWQGDFTGTSPQASITMDTPKVARATWTTSYMQLYIVVAAIVAAVAVAGFLFWRRRKASPPTVKPPPTEPSESGTGEPLPEGSRESGSKEATVADNPKCASCGTEVPAGQTFCHNCGAKMG